MAAPTVPISTEYLNAETDDPNLARVDLEKLAISHNLMMASYGVPSGFAMLDAVGKLSTAVFDKNNVLTALTGTNIGLDADTLDTKHASEFIHADGTVSWTTSQMQEVDLLSTVNNTRGRVFQFSNSLFTGTPVAGFGVDFEFALSPNTGVAIAAASLGAEWVSPTLGTATAALTFESRSLGVMETALRYYGRRFEMTETTVTPTGSPTPGSGKWWLYFLPAGLFIKDDTGTEIQIGAGTTLDHGSLLGRADDDHTQYLLVDGSRAMTGNLLMGANLIRFNDRADPASPASGQVYLYSKGQELYYKKFSGAVIGPLGSGGGGGSTTHAALTDLAAQNDDHAQYVLRQPTAAKPTVINESGGNFDFRVEGVSAPDLIHVFANTSTVVLNSNTALNFARLEVAAGAGRMGGFFAATDNTALYATSATGLPTLQSRSTGTAQAFIASRDTGSTPTVAVAQISELGTAGFRALDVSGRASTDTMRVRVGSVDAFRVTATSIVCNDSQHVYDFLIKSVSNVALFKVDSNANVVQVGGSTNVSAALNVNGGSLHGIHAVSTTGGKNAAYLESNIVATYAARLVGGAFGGRGQGITVTTARDETATFIKALASQTVQAAYAVQINVNDTTDTAHALHLMHSGTGDILRCEGPFATTNHYPFRVLPNGSTIWEFLGATPTPNPPTGTFALYFKTGGLYALSSAGVETGPMGVGGGGGGVTTHSALTDLTLNLDEHKQYVLRQPAAPHTETVINDSGANYNFRIEGLSTTPNLFYLHATNNSVGINVVPGTTGRLEIDAGGRYGIVANSTTLPAILASSTTGHCIWASGQATCVRGTRSVSVTPTTPIAEFSEFGTAGFRVLDVNGRAATDTMQVKVGTTVAFAAKATQIAINDSRAAYDFLIRSVGLDQMFAVSASGNAVYVGTTVAGGATVNVNAGALHGLYVLNTTAAKFAGYFVSRGASSYAVNAVGGDVGGVGSGVQATSVRSNTALFAKQLGGQATGDANAVWISVNDATDNAIALQINNVGTGDHIYCANASVLALRVLASGGTIWGDLTTDPDPPTGTHSLYFKGTGLYVKAPGAAAIGPLGTGAGGSTTHASLTDLAAQNDDHAQYVLRQPTVAKPTVINASAGDFDFNVRGLTNNNLLNVDAGNNVIAINRTAGSTTLGRLQILDTIGNPGLFSSSSTGTAVWASTQTGTAVLAQSTGGTVATFTRTATGAVGTLPVCDIIENDITNGYLVLRVTGSIITQPLAVFRHAGGAGGDRFTIAQGEVAINDAAQGYDFRVEGTTAGTLIQTSATNNAVGINCVPSISGRLEIYSGGSGRYGLIVNGVDAPAIWAGTTVASVTMALQGPNQLLQATRAAGSAPTLAMMQLEDTGIGFRLLDLNGKAATDVMRAKVGTGEVFSIKAASVVVNESSLAYDFNVKGVLTGQLLNVWASSDTVSVNGALAQARFNVQGGAMHGIYSLMNTTGKYAALFEQRAADWCLRVSGGTVTGGRGAGIWVSTGRDSVANFAKLLTAPDTSLGTYAVRIGVEANADTAMALSVVVYGSGDYLRSEDGGGTIFHRLISGGGMIMREQGADPAPAASYWGLYFKSAGLFYKPPGAAAAIGPLASATSAVGASHSLLSPASLAADDHLQYFYLDGRRALTGRLLMDANYIQLNNLAIPVAPAVGTIKLYSSGDMLAVRTSTGNFVVNDHSAMINLATGDPHTQYVLRQPVADTIINNTAGDFDFVVKGLGHNSLFNIDAARGVVSVNQGPQDMDGSRFGRLQVIDTGGLNVALTVQTLGRPAVYISVTTGAAITTNVISTGQCALFNRDTTTTPTTAAVAISELGTAGFRVLDVNGRAATDTMQVKVGTVEALKVLSGEVVVNDTASTYNFRVEGVTTPNLFTVVANSDTVSINSATPSGLARLEVLAGGRIGIGVTADTSHGIYVVQNTTAQRGVYVQAGTDANGRGVGISVESCRDAALVISKNLVSQTAASAYAVGVFVLQAADTAHGLLLTNYGTGDHIRVNDNTGVNHFRLLAGGGSYWSDLAADLATPGGSIHALYFKSDGLYIKNAVGTVFGPMLGTSGQTTTLSSGVGSLLMAGTTARPNAGWIHTNLKDGTAIRIPYWTTITG